MTDTEIVGWIVRRFEGGYVDHPHDKGGPTKYGVSQRFLAATYGRTVDREEIRALTFPRAVSILVDEFSARPKLHQINDPLLRLHAIDFAIHSGHDTAVRGLQVIRGVGRDGRWGPLTRTAVNNAPGDWLSRELLAYRIRLMGRLIAQNPKLASFAGGWMDRAAVLLTLRLPLPDPPRVE